MQYQLTRRNFLKAATAATAATAAAATTGSALYPNEVAASDRNAPNLYDLLADNKFHDKENKAISVEAMKLKLKDDYVSVSFGFTDCDTICGDTNVNLNALGKQFKDTHFIIINTFLPDDARDASRQGFESFVKGFGLDPAKVTVLFPDDYDNLRTIQKKFGHEGPAPQWPRHTSYVFLHKPGGEQFAKDHGNKPAGINSLAEALNNEQQARGLR